MRYCDAGTTQDARCSAHGAYQLGKHYQRQQVAVETAQAITKAIQNRAGVNETINNMDSMRLCLELSGVSEQCEPLRGLAKTLPAIISLGKSRGVGDDLKWLIGIGVTFGLALIASFRSLSATIKAGDDAPHE